MPMASMRCIGAIGRICAVPRPSHALSTFRLHTWPPHFCRPGIQCSAQQQQTTSTQQQHDKLPLSKQQLLDQSIAMFAAGAVLGPFCDSLHSSGDVLHYAQPTITSLGPIPLETCWWVPLLFGVAGLILGVSYPVLDELDATRQQQQQQQQQQGKQKSASRGSANIGGTASSTGLTPSWPTVLLCISLFVSQYKLSAILDRALLGTPGAADVVLLAYGLTVWRLLDNTQQGFGMSLLTAVSGPAIEVFLINVLHLYHYEHPQVLGIPTWIPWVYFCGGPAVGLLGRKVWATMSERSAAAE